MTGSADTSGGLRAGAAMVDITPTAGTHLGGSGMGEHRPAQTVLDPLYAKALVVEARGKRIVIVVLDLVIVAEDWTSWVRRTAAERFGLDVDAIVVHAVQTHSAPSLGHFMLDPDFPMDLPPDKEFMRGGDPPYYRFAADRAVEAIGQAVAALRPVRVGYARGLRHDLAFNRRVVNRQGRVEMPFPTGRRRYPLGPTHLLYPEGPADPEVGVLCLRDNDLNMVAMLLCYTCHPVNVFAWGPAFRTAVSADWPGVWSAEMRAAFTGSGGGEGCVPLVLNGCCGNVNPWDPFDPDAVPDHRRMGAELTKTARDVVASIDFSDADVVDYRSYKLPLDYREVPADRLAEVERILGDNPQPVYRDDNPDQVSPEWFAAASTRSIEHCKKRLPRFPYEIQVLRIGEAAFVALPGEPFTEGQLAIKLASPAPFTQVLHMVSHYVGYVPTRDAYTRFGHEASQGCPYWAKLAPGSLEAIAETATRMLGDVFETRGTA